MFGGSKQKQLVGLDIGSSSIKAVELKASRQGYELVSYGIEELAQDAVVDGAIMDAPLVAAGIANISRSKTSKPRTWPPQFPATP
jgi:type IV pilus assembly protein PilM